MRKQKLINEYASSAAALKSKLLDNVFLFEEAGSAFESAFRELLSKLSASKVFVVSGIPCDKLAAKAAFDSCGAELVYFTDFSPNPRFEEINQGAELFNETKADIIIGIGGGSAIDTSKCIRHFTQKNVPLIAMPTTAGTGSEATKFAVYYKDGVKQSLEAESVLPDYVVLCGGFLKSLPLYQRKCTFLDAYCQACESAFGRRRTGKSLDVAFTVIKAMSLIKDFYFEKFDSFDPEGSVSLNTYALLCSYCSGRSINYTRTAAPHAMSYKLSSMKAVPHGHAVALCFGPNFKKLADHYCVPESPDCDIAEILTRIADISFKVDPSHFTAKFLNYLKSIGIPGTPVSEEEADVLASSVNAQRLANNPLVYDRDELRSMYLEIGR